MKWSYALLMLLFLLAVPRARANYCQCEVWAVAPIEGSHAIENHLVARFEGKFYGNFDLGSGYSCRRDCALLAQRRYDEELLKEKLLPWVDELVAYGVHGYNCTGPTTFKIPVRVRAKLGPRTLGLARQQVIFLHRERSCFI